MTAAVLVKIVRSARGNLVAYEGTKRVAYFADSEFGTAEFDAAAWLSERLLRGDCNLSATSYFAFADVERHRQALAAVVKRREA